MNPSRRYETKPHLTQRERDILKLVHEGHPNKEIADALAIGVQTVKAHLHHAFRTLGASNRVEALRLYAKFVEQRPEKK